MLSRTREEHERTLAGIRQLDQRLTFKFAVVQRQLDRQLARILSDHGLSVTAYRILAIIEAFGETSAAELGRMGGLDKGLVSRCVADLVRGGLLETRPDPRSARRRILGLTGAGRDRLGALRPAVDARNARLHDLFAGEELARLHEALDRMTDHLARELDERASSAPAPPPEST